VTEIAGIIRRRGIFSISEEFLDEFAEISILLIIACELCGRAFHLPLKWFGSPFFNWHPNSLVP